MRLGFTRNPDNNGEWYALICVSREVSITERVISRVIGLDMGLKFFLSDSEGRKIENPEFYKKTLKRIKEEQRRLSRKKRDSKNRRKQVMKLAKLYQRLKNQRDDFLHKLSRFYVDNYDLIAIENLNIRGMVRNHKLSGSILDASWARFHQMLSYKAESAGKTVVRVDPKGTSKERLCGNDRDINAAVNILNRAGWGTAFAPSEVEPLLVRVSSIVEEGTGCLRIHS